MPQDHITTVNQEQKVTTKDPFVELGTTKEDIDTRVEDYERRLQALE